MIRRDRHASDVIRGFEPPIEAMVEAGEPLRVLGSVQYPGDEKLDDLIDRYATQLKKHELLAVHDTTEAAASRIVSNGFDRRFPRTSEDSPVRANSTFFWIHEPDIGNRAPSTTDQDHHLVFCALHDGHAFVSSYGSINRYVDGEGDAYEANELLLIHEYIRQLERGVAASETHTFSTLLPRGD